MKPNLSFQSTLAKPFLVLLLIAFGGCSKIEKAIPGEGAFLPGPAAKNGDTIVVSYLYGCPGKVEDESNSHCLFPFDSAGTFFFVKNQVFFNPYFEQQSQGTRLLLFDFSLQKGSHKDVFLKNAEANTWLWSIFLEDVTPSAQNEGMDFHFLLPGFGKGETTSEFFINSRSGITKYRLFETYEDLSDSTEKKHEIYSWPTPNETWN